MRGLFITFEGVDGCGKSTQMQFLHEYLAGERGIPCVVTREPGGCPISERIRELLLDVENRAMSPHTEALLYAAARVQHIDSVIRPAVESGKIVLCDRYIDSSIAYQGYARALGPEQVLAINAYAVEHMMPDQTFFFDFAPEDARGRMHRRVERDRLEMESMDFFDRVYDGFRAVVQRYPQRILAVDVSGTKFETRDKLRSIMDGILRERGMF